MAEFTFGEPVVLTLPWKGERKVADSFEALECLMEEWPASTQGRAWQYALAKCRDALDGWCAAEKARNAFVEAARQAGFNPVGRPSMPPWWMPQGAMPTPEGMPRAELQ